MDSGPEICGRRRAARAGLSVVRRKCCRWFVRQVFSLLRTSVAFSSRVLVPRERTPLICGRESAAGIARTGSGPAVGGLELANLELRPGGAPSPRCGPCLQPLQADDCGVNVVKFLPKLRQHFVQIHDLSHEDSTFRFRIKSEESYGKLMTSVPFKRSGGSEWDPPPGRSDPNSSAEYPGIRGHARAGCRFARPWS